MFWTAKSSLRWLHCSGWSPLTSLNLTDLIRSLALHPRGRQRLFISLTDPNWRTVAAYGTPLPPCLFCLSFTMLLQIIQVQTCQNTQVWRIKLQYVFAWSRASLCSSAPARGSKCQAASRKPRDDFANANSALSTYILYKATRPKALRLL